MENALNGHIDILHLRQHLLQERQENTLRSLGQVGILHGGPAHHRSKVDGVFPVGDSGDMEHRVFVCQRVITRMVAEGSLDAALMGQHIAFQNDFRRGRHLDIHGLALHHFHRLVPEEPGKDHFVNIPGQGSRSCISQHRVRADGHCALDFLAAGGLHVTVVLRPVLMDMPVHARGTAVVLLQAVHAHIALAGLGILGKDQRQGHERPSVLRPALENGNFVQIGIFRLHHFLARGGFHILGEIHRPLDHGNHGDHAHLVLQGYIGQLQHFPKLICNVVQLLHAQGQGHALIAAKGIDEHGHLGALHVLKEDSHIFLSRALGNAVHNLRDFQLRVNFRLDALQEAAAFQLGHELAQIFICQRDFLLIYAGYSAR